MKRLAALSFSVGLGATVCHAETSKYITDVLYVPIRTGPSADQKVIKNLRSGTQLKVVADALENGYMNVATSDGTSGWIPERYLVDHPTATDRVASADAKISSTVNLMNQLKSDLDAAKKDRATLEKELRVEKDRKDALSNELKQLKEISSGSLDLAKERDRLNQRVVQLESENDKLKESNTMLSGSNQNEGMKLGIMAVLFGIFLGVVFPYLKPRARRGTSLKLR